MCPTLGQVVAAQFPTKLAKYAEQLVTQKNDFQVAMVMQIARDVDMMGMWLPFSDVSALLNVALKASMTSDDFLRKRLYPADQQPLDDGCLEGTRVGILREAREWLQDCTSGKNILWIVGAPGAGKSTIATTIVRELAATAPFCSKFFSKRDVPHLRDPRQIWRTLAYSLAVKHDGVKVALMVTLNEKKNNEPKDDLVVDQFHQLIKGPLESDLKERRLRLHKLAYPVIVIDALDECNSASDNSWQSLLLSLAGWAELPGVFKLIVTSRDHFDLRANAG